MLSDLSAFNNSYNTQQELPIIESSFDVFRPSPSLSYDMLSLPCYTDITGQAVLGPINHEAPHYVTCSVLMRARVCVYICNHIFN
jgi:hypothetical protein